MAQMDYDDPITPLVFRQAAAALGWAKGWLCATFGAAHRSFVWWRFFQSLRTWSKSLSDQMPCLVIYVLAELYISNSDDLGWNRLYHLVSLQSNDRAAIFFSSSVGIWLAQYASSLLIRSKGVWPTKHEIKMPRKTSTSLGHGPGATFWPIFQLVFRWFFGPIGCQDEPHHRPSSVFSVDSSNHCKPLYKLSGNYQVHQR